MDKIVMTELGKSYFDLTKSTDHLPLLKKIPSKPNNENSLEATKQNYGAFNVLSLRKLLQD